MDPVTPINPVTTISVYVDGRHYQRLSQPGFYVQLRDLLAEFGVNTAETSLITIEESEA